MLRSKKKNPPWGMPAVENWEMRNPIPCYWKVGGWGWGCSCSRSSGSPSRTSGWEERCWPTGRTSAVSVQMCWLVPCAVPVQYLYLVGLELNGKSTRRELRPFRGADRTANRYPSYSKSRVSREFRVKLMGGPGKKSLNCRCHDK